MPISEHLDYILIASLVTGLLSFFYLSSFLLGLKKFRLIHAFKKMTGLVLFSLATGFLSLIILTSKGYQALTYESHVADLLIQPTGSKTFTAKLIYADGRQQNFNLAGDEVMIESNILKWKSWSNILGLKTAYRLDRIRGRYKNIQVEKLSSPTLFSLNDETTSDIADWRQEYQQLRFLVDVEHGSASYVPANQTKIYQLMVSSDGLILRSKSN